MTGRMLPGRLAPGWPHLFFLTRQLIDDVFGFGRNTLLCRVPVAFFRKGWERGVARRLTLYSRDTTCSVKGSADRANGHE